MADDSSQHVTSPGSHHPHEADAFSDDSGVDVKPRYPQRRLAEDASSFADNARPPPSRNKRKSSEPRRRKDVLLMKRFRWEDTDDEDVREDLDEEEDYEDSEVFEVQRPSSGDSGCRIEEADEEDTRRSSGPDFAGLRPDGKRKEEEDEVLQRPNSGDSGCCRLEEEDTRRGPDCSEKKGRRRAWRKPKVEEDCEDTTPPAFRQSVIRKNETLPHDPTTTTTTTTKQAGPSSVEGCGSAGPLPRAPRNYKSMSRQRRIEANARERTRVHTISAAFESLRRAVPAYAHNQKLSKLAVLRIASAYIVALACLNGGGGGGEEDTSSSSPMAECVERCTRTIQAEGRSRRRTAKE